MVKLGENARNAADRIKLLFVNDACLAASEGKEEPIYKVKAKALRNYFNLANGELKFNENYKKKLRCESITSVEEGVIREELTTSYTYAEDKVRSLGFF